jgi:pimeloyl-ACP methyl ester carboxylesterase
MYSSTLRFKAADGCELHAEISGGTQPELLLLHGFGDGSFVWKELTQKLGGTGSVALDLRGHGQSGWDPRGEYELDTHAADVAQLIDHLGWQPRVVLGHSLGASVAIRVATRLPRLQGLVIVDGGPEVNLDSVSHLRERFRQQSWRYACAEDFLSALQDRLPRASDELLRQFAQGAARVLADGVVELRCDPALAHVPERDEGAMLRGMLAKIRCPTLLIRGAWSAMLPRDVADRLRPELSMIQVYTVPQAGHTVMLENPDEFHSAVRRFLDRLDAIG